MKLFRRKIHLWFIIFVFFLLGCQGKEMLILPNGELLTVEVARTREEQSRGLMERENLGDHDAMLFVYDREDFRTFWMKNTLIPLDIIFLDSNWKIVDMKNMQPCSEDPCALYPSLSPAQYAVEVKAGSLAEWGLKVGDEIGKK